MIFTLRSRLNMKKRNMKKRKRSRNLLLSRLPKSLHRHSGNCLRFPKMNQRQDHKKSLHSQAFLLCSQHEVMNWWSLWYEHTLRLMVCCFLANNRWRNSLSLRNLLAMRNSPTMRSRHLCHRATITCWRTKSWRKQIPIELLPLYHRKRIMRMLDHTFLQVWKSWSVLQWIAEMTDVLEKEIKLNSREKDYEYMWFFNRGFPRIDPILWLLRNFEECYFLLIW